MVATDGAPHGSAAGARPTAAAEPEAIGRQPAERAEAAAWLFLSPYLALFMAFLLAPSIAGVVISFMHWDLLQPPGWAGLDNYREIFGDPLFWTSVLNTVYFVVLAALPMIALGLMLALLLNQRIPGRNLLRTVVFMPHVLMVSAVGILWVWMYDTTAGLINFYLAKLGIERIGWLTDTDWSMPALAITTIWWTVNVNMLIYLAALQDIPEELHEAATIDGAGAWARFRYVTLPMLLPVTALVTCLTIVACWRVFGQAYVMTKGGPETSTFVVVQYIYLTAFQSFRMGPAAAAGVFLMAVTLIFSLVQLRAMKAI